MSQNALENLSGLSWRRLAEYLSGWGAKPIHSSALLRCIHSGDMSKIGEMPSLSAALKQHLHNRTEVCFPSLEKTSVAADGTRKYLMRLADGHLVETVLIPSPVQSPRRLSLCVSSQTGCGLGCTFCATAQKKPCRNLSAAEIVGQLWRVNQELRSANAKLSSRASKAVSNVVFMGMGEPLLNRKAVFEAIEIMRDDYAYALGRRKIVVSTVGYVPGILEMARSTDVGLVVSLHSPENELRDRLIPLNRKYPIEAILDACQKYLTYRPYGETVTFAYTLLRGANDSLRHANLLADLVGRLPSKVNLIPFNAYPGAAFQRTSPEVTDAFRKALLARGIVAMVRCARGDDISAACGQLCLNDAEMHESANLRVSRKINEESNA